jgi:hypothetical protein
MVPFDELLEHVRDQHPKELVRLMKQHGIDQRTLGTWIARGSVRGSVPSVGKREAAIGALEALGVARAETEASLAISDRLIAMTGGYAGQDGPELLIKDRVERLEAALAQLRGSAGGRRATAELYRFVTDPCLNNAVAAVAPSIGTASRLLLKLVRSRDHYCAILAEEVPGIQTKHNKTLFRLAVRNCAGSAHEIFRPWDPEERILPYVVFGAKERRTDQAEIDEIYCTVIATAWLLASRTPSP